MRSRRADEIGLLKLRYARAMRERRWKDAGVIYAQLCRLVTRQLKSEIRHERRKAA